MVVDLVVYCGKSQDMEVGWGGAEGTEEKHARS